MSIKSTLSRMLPPRIVARMSTIGRVIRLTRDEQTNKYMDTAIQMAIDADSYLRATGFLDSKVKFLICDGQGDAIPWMNYCIVQFLNDRLQKNHEIFEYGSGFSTLFFSRKAAFVRSAEYDREWYERITSMTNDHKNVEVIFQPLNDEYPHVIQRDTRKYDLVIIDGRMRVKAAINAVNNLTDDGVVILDDSNREKYKEVETFFLKKGFKSLTFTGLAPMGWKQGSTTIFYRTNNCLNI